MIRNYALVFTKHAGSMMRKRLSMPDAALGIGAAEVLHPMPKIDYRQSDPRQIQVSVKTVDDLMFTGRGSKVDPANFPTEYYEGEMV